MRPQVLLRPPYRGIILESGRDAQSKKDGIVNLIRVNMSLLGAIEAD